MFTEEQIKEIMEGAQDEIRTALIEDMKLSLKNTVEWEIKRQTGEVVKAFIETEIVPELQAALIDDKPVILKAAIDTANETAQILAEAMVETVRQKLGKDYERRAFLTALFG
jgi:hypothetical protein